MTTETKGVAKPSVGGSVSVLTLTGLVVGSMVGGGVSRPVNLPPAAPALPGRSLRSLARCHLDRPGVAVWLGLETWRLACSRVKAGERSVP